MQGESILGDRPFAAFIERAAVNRLISIAMHATDTGW